MERKHWTPQEDEILSLLVQDIGYGNWTLVALRLGKKFEGRQRSGKQCRERWFNHLDKNINKYSWREEQEQIIFQMHKVHGNKWKEIAKSLENRTQNDIKNHFYATLRKGIRRMNKFIGFKKNPNQIRSIKPSILSELCLQSESFDQVSSHHSQTNIVDLIFKFSKTQLSEKNIDSIIENQALMQKIDHILQNILEKNLEYEDEKKKKVDKTKEMRKKREHKSDGEEGNKRPSEFDISEYLCLDIGGWKSEEWGQEKSSSPLLSEV